MAGLNTIHPAPNQAIQSCANCAVGHASGVLQGRYCPFVDRHYRAGETIYMEGGDADRVWLVKKGTVVLLKETDSGPGKAHAVRFPGSMIGLEALVNRHYVDSAHAVSDATLCGAKLETVDAWLGPKGSTARTALEITLQATCSEVMRRSPVQGNAVRRVASWLLHESPRETVLTLPRHFIADLLGMRAETLSRALAELARREAIIVTRKSLRINDVQRLEEAAIN